MGKTRRLVLVPPMLPVRRMVVMRPVLRVRPTLPVQPARPMPHVPPMLAMPQTPPVPAIPPTLPMPLAREQQAWTQPPHATAPQQPTRPPPARLRPPAPREPAPPTTQSHIPHRTPTTQRVAWAGYAGCATFPGAHRLRCNAVLLSSSSDCGSDGVRIDHGAAAIEGVHDGKRVHRHPAVPAADCDRSSLNQTASTGDVYPAIRQ
jgi:hypothetical protein